MSLKLILQHFIYLHNTMCYLLSILKVNNKNKYKPTDKSKKKNKKKHAVIMDDDTRW